MRGLITAGPAAAVAVGVLLCLPAPPAFAASAAAGSWVRLQTGTTLNLNDVYGAAASTFAVGPNGTFLYFDGLSWHTVPTPTTSELHAVWAGSGTVIAVGDAGRVLRFDGQTLALEPFVTSRNLYGAWGRNANDIYAVGDNGTILHYDGATWTRQTSGTALRLNDVWGAGETAFAVGANGTIVGLHGNEWSVVSTPTTLELNGVWVGSGRALAVGNYGTILSLEGGQWVRVPSGTTRNLTGTWIVSSSRAFAVGEAGTILFSDGGAWELMDYVTSSNLTAINNGYTAGNFGTILQNTAAFVEVGNLRVTEVLPERNIVEVTNTGPAFESPELVFSHRDDFGSAIPARTFFEAGAIDVFEVFGLSSGLSRTDSDVWLYRAAPFGDPRNIVHGTKYGGRADVGETATAVAAGIWPSLDAHTPSPASGMSIAWDGFGLDPLDWYVDATPSPGVPNVTPVGSVQNRIVFPSGVQNFEDVTLGDEVVAIRNWNYENTSGIEGIYTARAVGDAVGVARGPGESSDRWLRIRDQDPRDVDNRFHTATIQSPMPFNYSWEFDVLLEEAPPRGTNAPALVIEHPVRGVFTGVWGVRWRGDTAYLFVTGAGGTASEVPVYKLTGSTAVGQWVHVGIDVNLVQGQVTASVGGIAAGVLPVAPAGTVDATRYRLSHEGSGPGNVGTLLLDNVAVQADVNTPLPVVFTFLLAGPADGAIGLEWEVAANKPLESFLIVRREGEEPPSQVAAVAGAARSYRDAGVRRGVLYRYTITARTTDGEAVTSSEASAALPSEPPRPAFRRWGAYPSGSSVVLGWDVVGEETIAGYRVYRRVEGGVEVLIVGEPQLDGGARGYRDTDVEMWKQYEYVVAAVDANGDEVRSKASTVRIVAAAAALSPPAPNPFRTKTQFQFTLPQAADVTLAVYDVRGKLVTTLERGMRAAGVHTVSWDGRDGSGRAVSAGTYFCKLATPGAVLTRKTVVVR